MKNISRVPIVGLLAIGLVLIGGLSHVITKVAHAGTVIAFKDTVSVPTPGSSADHTVVFTTASNVDAGETITITWVSGYDTAGGLDYSDIDVDDDVTPLTLAGTCSGSTWGAAFAADVLTITSCDGTIAAGSVVTVKVGTHASGGDQQIENPSKVAAEGTADVYDLTIGGTFGDTGTTKIAVIEGVAVSVTIDESLSFVIAGVNSGSCTGDTGTPTAVTTTAATVPFSTVNTEAFYAGCQTLTTTTNATDGFGVTALSNRSLKSAGAGDLINSGTCGAGACTKDTGGAWATGTDNGFAYWCENGSGTPCSTAGDSTSEHRIFACSGADADCDPGTGAESGVTVLSLSAPVSGSVGTIHYKLSVSGTQPAGTYSNTVTYVVTPTF